MATGKRFEWDEKRDVQLLREILFRQPYQFKAGTKESSRMWRLIVESLHACGRQI